MSKTASMGMNVLANAMSMCVSEHSYLVAKASVKEHVCIKQVPLLRESAQRCMCICAKALRLVRISQRSGFIFKL